MKTRLICGLSLFYFLPGALASEEATALILKGEKILRGNTLQMVMSMKVSRPDFTRQLKLRSWTEGKNKALVEIVQPAKEEGVTSLRVDSQMWNYLPKTDATIRVPTSLMLQSWMGSDFTNDDLMKMSSVASDYTHEKVRSETVEGQNTFLIQCLPKPDAPVVWGKISYWLRASDSLPVKEEFYDDRGTLVRTLYLREFKKMDDRVIPTVLTIVKASNPNESTTVVYEKLMYDRLLDGSLFSRERLRKISQEGRQLASGWKTEPLRSGS